jgi:membrane AbrB-like protein
MKLHADAAARAVLALGLGAAAGYLFFIAGMPLPWMMGAMIANAVAALCRLPIGPPTLIRPAMTGVLGTMLGAYFGAEFLSQLLLWKVTLAGMLACTLVGAGASFFVLRRLGGMSPSTAYFAAMPGGLAEMTMLAEQSKADVRVVALVHAFRIFLTVLVLPVALGFVLGTPIMRDQATGELLAMPAVETLLWLVGTATAGCALGHMLRLPAKFLLGPLVLSAAVHISGISNFTVAPVLVAVAQVVIGTNIGTRFAGFDKRLIFRTAGVAVVTTMVLLLVAAMVAYVVGLLSAMPFVVLLLAYSPGGLAEMSLIALALHLEIAFVATHHLFRVLSVIFIGRLLSSRFTD